MISVVSRLRARFGHISDETLADLISGELGSLRTVRARAHMSRCWQCRARREELEKAALLVVEYSKRNLASCMPLDPRYRQSFLARVQDETGAKPRPVIRWPRLIPLVRTLSKTMSPVFASVIVIAVAFMALFWIWKGPVTPVSASELLHRAEISDRQHIGERTTGVLYQQVAVKSGQATFRHSIYRDLSGRRKMHAITLSASEQVVQQKLETAGVAWDQPLSAAAYKEWHDRQNKPLDEVRRAGSSQLILTTKLDGGEIAQESLTVRADDFHPIKRIVEMRNQEIIEIAELDFAVLGWNAVNQALFEPLAEPSVGIGVSALSTHEVLPRALPSAMQVDIAELAARSVLNQLNSDVQDQVRVSHTESGVVVKGIIGTDERKREIISRLNQIAYVRAEILSTEEMQAHPANTFPQPSTGGEAAQLYTASPQLAPLAAYLQERDLPADQLSETSKHLLSASLEVQQAGAQLVELRERFANAASLPSQARTQFDMLAGTNRHVIEEGLAAELDALDKVGFTVQGGSAMSSVEDIVANEEALQRSIEDNQRLCQELIVAPLSNPRPASVIVGDIGQSIKRIKTLLAIQKTSPQP